MKTWSLSLAAAFLLMSPPARAVQESQAPAKAEDPAAKERADKQKQLLKQLSSLENTRGKRHREV